MEPYYDPGRDRIVGARRGTWAYHHEAIHREQYRRHKGLNDTLAKVHIRGYYAAIIGSFVLGVLFGLKGILYAIGLSMFPHVAIIFLMEAEAYARGSWNYWRRTR